MDKNNQKKIINNEESIIVLDDDARDVLLKVLENPPEPTEALKDLFK